MRSGDCGRVGERCEIETDSPYDVRDRRDFVDRAGAPVPRLEYRLREAARLGFTTAVVPTLRKNVAVPGMGVVQADTLQDALAAILR